MSSLVLLPLLLLVVTAAASVNITVLNQTNVGERWPVLSNRVRCQNITDIYRQPLVMAADDAVLPDADFFRSQGLANGLADCGAMTFRFSGIRIRSMSNPESITILFMRDVNHSPGSVFYQKTLPAPSNNYLWVQDQGYLGRPWPYDITLQWNEVGDDGTTRFDFRSVDFMPPLQTFWIAFYCTGPQQAIGGVRINAMFWVTQSNVSNATALQTSLTGGLANNPFFFRDVTNVLGANFVNWTDAQTYQSREGLVAPTNNMAWCLFFTCNLVATQAPTTSAPTTAQPTSEAIPTVPLETAPTWAPVFTAGNRSNLTLASVSTVVAATLVPTLLALCCLVALCITCCVRRRQRQRERMTPNAQDPVQHTVYTEKKKTGSSQFEDYRDMQIQYHEPILGRGGGGDDDGGERNHNPLTRMTLSSVYDATVNTSSDAPEYDQVLL